MSIKHTFKLTFYLCLTLHLSLFANANPVIKILIQFASKGTQQIGKTEAGKALLVTFGAYQVSQLDETIPQFVDYLNRAPSGMDNLEALIYYAELYSGNSNLFKFKYIEHTEVVIPAHAILNSQSVSLAPPLYHSEASDDGPESSTHPDDQALPPIKVPASGEPKDYIELNPDHPGLEELKRLINLKNKTTQDMRDINEHIGALREKLKDLEEEVVTDETLEKILGLENQIDSYDELLQRNEALLEGVIDQLLNEIDSLGIYMPNF